MNMLVNHGGERSSRHTMGKRLKKIKKEKGGGRRERKKQKLEGGKMTDRTKRRGRKIDTQK